MVNRRGYRKCRELVAKLPLPRPFSVPTLVEMLAAHRGRPIYVGRFPAGLSVNACGAWLSLADRDVIFVESGTSRYHREHIVLHELGHMLCEHDSGTEDVVHGLSRLLPDLSPELIERLLQRTGYGTQEEQEAELVASLIRIAGDAQTRSTGVLGELEAALGLPGHRP